MMKEKQELDAFIEKLEIWLDADDSVGAIVEGPESESPKDDRASLPPQLRLADKIQSGIGRITKAGQVTLSAVHIANAAGKFLKAAAKTVLVVDVLFTVADIGSVVAQWTTRNPQVKEIDTIIENIL